ncbi:MAG: HAD family hydrolase [Pyrinomonadaceae bacterium]
MRSPAVFLDRDGTLVEEVNFLSRVEDLRVFPYSVQAVCSLKEHGFKVFVVTNQSGIARRKFAEPAMHSIHLEIQNQLGGLIDAFYYCPHLPDAGCRCRKPDTGMIEAAARDYDIDLAKSWMVGDKKLDVETGKNALLRTALVLTGYGAAHRATLEFEPDIITTDLGDAVTQICLGTAEVVV